MTQSENFTVVFIRSLTANLFSNILLIYGDLLWGIGVSDSILDFQSKGEGLNPLCLSIIVIIKQ